MVIATTTPGGPRQAGRNPRTRELAALTAARLAAGERLASIAEDVGVAPSTLRKHLRDTGQPAGRRAAPAGQEGYRVQAHAMPPGEAIDWLCDVIEMQRGWGEDLRWRVMEHGFTRQQAGFLLTLARAGDAVAYERLGVAMRAMRPGAEAPGLDHVQGVVSRVRGRLAALRWRAAVLTVRDFGYRLHRRPGFAFPWERPS